MLLPVSLVTSDGAELCSFHGAPQPVEFWQSCSSSIELLAG